MMRMILKISFSLLALACLSAGRIQAQQETQVLTKRIERSFAYRPGIELNIDGNRAEVYLEPGSGSTITITLELIARHPDKEQAKQDLEKMVYSAQRIKDHIYLRNYLDQPDQNAPTASQLSAVYRIQVPPDCPVYIKNAYGLAEASNISTRLKINSRFGSIGLNNVSGDIDVSSRFGDLIGQHLDGTVHIDSRRTDITLREISGSYDINAEYGLLRIFASEGLLDFNLTADKSDVYLYNVDLPAFGYQLTVQNGRIDYPSELNFNLLDLGNQTKKVVFRPESEYYPSISVSVTFGDIYVGK